MHIPINSLEDLDALLSSCPKVTGETENEFYLSLIKTFNSILYFISHQEGFQISEPSVQEQVCAFVIDSPFFKAHYEPLYAHLRSSACSIQPDNELYRCLWLVYRILVLLSCRLKHTLRFELADRSVLVPKLLEEIRVPLDSLLQLPALLLLTELFKSSSFTSTELKIIDENVLRSLFDLSEGSRVDDESISYAVNHLLLCIHHQTLDVCPNGLDPFSGFDDFCRFRKNLKDFKFNDPFADSEATHDFMGLSRCSPVLRFLENNLYTAKSFGEDLIFMLNREDDESNTCSLLNFFTDMFNHPLTSEYLYTNDLVVLVDIIIRELCDLDDSSDELRYTFMCTLTSLMTFSQYRKSPHKLNEIHRLLNHIVQNPSGAMTEVSAQCFSQAAKLLNSWAP